MDMKGLLKALLSDNIRRDNKMEFTELSEEEVMKLMEEKLI